MHADHRKLGRELDLFDSDPLIGAGLPFWLPAGAAARHAVESYLHELERRHGYQHVYSPALGKRQLFEKSGHWRNFAEDMFPPMAMGGDELVLRPSQCPHHALIYKSRGRSYRDLPLRIAELGPMYRAERSGVLGGLSRVRAIQLNDAHIFCAAEQAAAEVADVLGLMRQVHAALGIEPSSFQLSLRGEGKQYGGDEAGWASAEALLREALEVQGIPFQAVRGEAAFYGPKIDVQVADSAGREWSLATVQIDYHQPEAFDLEYADSSGGRSRPVMIHRSLAGSLERLFAHLIEVHDGAFPLWYSPVQLAVLPVSESESPEADALAREAIAAGLRVSVAHEGSIGARIREAAESRIPYAGIIGKREAPDGLVALRHRDGRQVPAMPVAAAIRKLSEEAKP
ncbi:threonine--tRNA ligase [Paractinoplanes abujensis]|uniref:Threonine--tRNA ligase n=1 Tax=Paractinoplanes abujensis TaxID=882441 RepID=A0A7W7CYU2_9ACTN|nr:threonine--tRNA ligase [Actinoplanes abujensis]MBB4697184.1 threonyl-tRNA synthetase [Actinoplanes abujensis]GID18344.1 threonine--tRNA ligase [Actinoplanes abujensis]